MTNIIIPTPIPLNPAPNIAIVVSQFNHDITAKLLSGALERLGELSTEASLIAWVPGAIEIPVTIQRLAKKQKYDAIIALGAVIRGETSHYDYVCQQASQGCQEVALKQDIPVIFGILTTDTEEQAMERVGGAHGHKGRDSVDAAFQMIQLLRQM